MRNKATLIIFKEQSLQIGVETFIDSCADNGFAVAFEDDTETGYFYAIDTREGQVIIDALHIYDVPNIIDRNKPSLIKILWSKDQTIAILSINNYYHALFDFERRGGYCRNGFPESNSDWTLIKERVLNDKLIEELIEQTKS